MNKRHIWFWRIFRPLLILYTKLKFGYTYEKAKDLPDTYIVLSNHVTDYDPLFVASSFPRQMYFVASEHVARWKTLYRFLKYAVEPIIRLKGTIAASTVIEVLRKVKAGANVCVFAEGVRTWDGVTCPILPSTGKLIKSAKCGLVTYKITGGYFVSPGWSQSNLRKGYIHGAPVHIYTKEDIAAMSIDEINAHINEDLYEDAYATQMTDPKKYKGKDLAKYIENLLFICPECSQKGTITSHDDTIECSACHSSFKYNEYGMIENCRFETVRDLSNWQKKEVQKDADNGKTYTADYATLTQIVKHEETLSAEGKLSLSPTHLTCGDKEIPLSKISDIAIHGRHALVFSVGKEYFELLPKTPKHALKFLLLFNAYKNNTK